MNTIILVFTVIAFVFCAEAAPNNPYQFGNSADNPYVMSANIFEQIKNMMNPENLKNQKGDGSMAAMSSSIKNGVPEFHGVLANTKNGDTNVREFHGP